jgi:hypothetical protein
MVLKPGEDIESTLPNGGAAVDESIISHNTTVMINEERLTDYKKRLDDHVADHGRFVRVDETGVVWYNDCNVERGYQYQPIPASFEHPIVR